MAVIRGYSRYFVVGVTVGIVTIGVRELIAVLLPADSPVYYTTSVSLAYLLGILMSYSGHRVFSFRGATAVGGTAVSLTTFSVIALIGLASTAAMAALIRYGLPLERIIGGLEPTAAFAFANFMSSFMTYVLNARFTFVRAEDGGR